jgi:hypothetical protein
VTLTLPKARVFGAASVRSSRAGALRVSGRYLVDDAGPWRPLGATFFWLPWGVVHDPARTEANVIHLAEQGIDFVRILGEVGGESWEDRSIDPRDPGYEAALAGAIDMAAAHGLKVMLTIFGGGTGAPVDLTVDKVLNVIGPRRTALALLELSNEDNWPGTVDDLRRIARRIRAALPDVVLLPHSPDSGELAETAAYLAPDGCNALTMHPERQVGDAGWRVVRQTWGQSFPCPLVAGEPAGMHLGQGEDVNDPIRLACMRAVGLLTGFQAFVLHTGPGVRGGGSWDGRYGRAANFYDLPDLPAAVTALRAVESIVPLDAANWRKTSQHGREPFADNPLPADAIWSDDGETHGVSRQFVAYSGGQIVALILGVNGYSETIAHLGVQGTVHALHTGEVFDISIPAGGRYRFAGDPDANAAYIFVGRFTP